MSIQGYNWKFKAQQKNLKERVERMQDERLPKSAFKYQPVGKWSRGHPKKRWKDQFLKTAEEYRINKFSQQFKIKNLQEKWWSSTTVHGFILNYNCNTIEIYLLLIHTYVFNRLQYLTFSYIYIHTKYFIPKISKKKKKGIKTAKHTQYNRFLGVIPKVNN
jgi:hypothetical protein